MKVVFEKGGKVCTFDLSGLTLTDAQIMDLWKKAVEAIEKKIKEEQ